VHVDPEDGEHAAQIAGNGRLAGEQRLDAVLDRDAGGVDLVVEGDRRRRVRSRCG
jgi:hypothetical protein